MKRTLLFITTLAFVFSLGLFAQQQTSDGGYIIAGASDSYSNGEMDFLVYKLDTTGKKQWRKNYGGLNWDGAIQIKQTSDGGYIVSGSSDSYGGMSGFFCDFLVYKLAADGTKQWRKNYGSFDCDHAWGVLQASRWGYLVSGDTSNFVHGGAGDTDFLVYRINGAGAKLWRKNYGGMWEEKCARAAGTGDGGFIILGTSLSYTNGGADFLVYRIDASGNKQWRKNYGGGDDEIGVAVQRTMDGGFVLCGTTESYVHTSALRGEPPAGSDILVYKLDAAGNKLWRKNLGGTNRDEGFDIRQTSDGGYILCGRSLSFTHGGNDMIVYRLDAAGVKVSRKNYGGIYTDRGAYIVPTADGGTMLFGDTTSYTNGGFDFLVYKLDASGNKQWRKNYGGSKDEIIDTWE